MDIKDTGNRYDSKQVTINQSDKEAGSFWNVDLTTTDLPPEFVNANRSSRQVELSVIDLNNTEDQLEQNSIVIPIELNGVTQTNGEQSKFYFRNRFEAKINQLAPSATIEGYITQDNDDVISYENPHLLISFSIDQTNQDKDNQTMSSNDTNQSNDTNERSEQKSDIERQQFSGERQTGGYSEQKRPVIDENENANGGTVLPVGADKQNEMQN